VIDQCEAVEFALLTARPEAAADRFQSELESRE